VDEPTDTAQIESQEDPPESRRLATEDTSFAHLLSKMRISNCHSISRGSMYAKRMLRATLGGVTIPFESF
jgi:hypothetical protein